ncbi:hypothetical protein OBBRIDRAFT_891791 [Obba rivulosa]|uniref:UvrD-like helicase ATP-binding domain-containing protein n=1 Tax=Obba rivulosa TaxID=1052685 RepID=A0A8E2AMA3_9APHY|nr:hypothetical protein OBBRIDRAFT_891791 [Obba rivulosa]
MISVCDSSVFSILREHITTTFPKEPRAFLSSIQSPLLKQFSQYFASLTWPSHKNKPPSVVSSHNAVILALPALEAIAHLLEDLAPGLPKEVQRSTKMVAKSSRRDGGPQRRGWKFPSCVMVDPKPFADLRVDVPLTYDEAERLARDVLQDQRQVLEYYLKLLRDPELVDPIRESCLGTSFSGGESLYAGTQAASAGAYPLVQPMKAALHFENADGFGEWHLLMSTRAQRDLRAINRRDRKLCEIVVRKLKDLSHGLFSNDNQRRLNLNQSSSDIPIYKVVIAGEYRLVYQVHCIQEYGKEEVEHQVLRIFGIYTLAELVSLGSFWDRVAQRLSRISGEYKQRCIGRSPADVSGRIQPKSFSLLETGPLLPDIGKANDVSQPSQNSDELEIHALLMLDRYVELSQEFLTGILADKKLSSTELKIIGHTSSCYVIGRSGTGKTTAMIFKILALERSWNAYGKSMPKPRQVFVTKSAILARKVEQYYIKLARLALLSDSAETFDWVPGYLGEEQKVALYDHDEKGRQDLPRSLEDLTDDHFPLFVTIDQLLDMLEAYIHSMNPVAQVPGNVGQHRRARRSGHTCSGVAGMIDYDRFVKSYWPHFVACRLDSASVFGEFIGVIKGSEPTLQLPGNTLSRQSYFEYSGRSQATFADQRNYIYDLFELYKKLKRDFQDIDAADRTHSIIRGLQGISLSRVLVDFLYVDEAQDNLLIDAFVLRMLCRNASGLFWAGDTAQAIALGSSFNFSELKAFNWRIEADRRKNNERKNDPQPETFQLTLNYRSHSGIVDCAHSVVELIKQLWPNSIDNLAEEHATDDGPKPRFYNDPECADPRILEQFLFGTSQGSIDFGAEQCILVRSDEVRQRLRSILGEAPNIFTILESKGLEFNDVLLYRFFADSPVDITAWKFLYRYCHEQTMPYAKANVGLCREMKSLYVSLTRARNRLWIVDCSENAESMRQLWSKKGQIEDRYLTLSTCERGFRDTAFRVTSLESRSPEVSHFARGSSNDAWAKAAETFFHTHLYADAERCFRRAGRSREEGVARAFRLRQEAISIPLPASGSSPARTRAFISAAEQFARSARDATDIKDQREYLWQAARCWSIANENLKAAEAYLEVQEYGLSAQHFRLCNELDRAVDIVQEYSDFIDEGVANSIKHVARLHYLRKAQFKKTTKLFASQDEALEFMEEYDLHTARAKVYERQQKWLKAAELHLSEGRKAKAIKLFMKDGSAEGFNRAERALVDSIWECLSFASPLTFSADVDDPLQLIKDLLACPDDVVSSHGRKQFEILSATRSGDLDQLSRLGKLSFVKDDVDTTLFCLDRVYSNSLGLPSTTIMELVDTLSQFFNYVCAVRKVARYPASSASLQRVFGYRPSETSLGKFMLRQGSFLHHAVLRDCTVSSSKASDKAIMLTGPELARLLNTALDERLRDRVLKEDSLCRSAAALPCVLSAVFKNCNLNLCDKQHLAIDQLTTEHYHAQFRVLLRQIMICQISSPALKKSERLLQRRHWIRELYHLLYPPFYKLGSRSIIMPRSIPEFSDGIRILKEWIHQLFNSLSPSDPEFLGLLIITATLASFLDSQNAERYMNGGQCVILPDPPKRLLRPTDGEGKYIARDLLNSLLGNAASATSAGVLAVTHITEQRLHIDVNVLCHLLEYLGGSFILGYRGTQFKSFHNVTLPRTWLAHYDLIHVGRRDWDFLKTFMDQIERLLMEIFRGSERLTFGGTETRRLPYNVNHIFVYRVCRLISLMGYNIPLVKLRDHILTIFKPLGRIEKLPYLYKSYAHANNWNDIASAVRRSTSDSVMDELVRLVDARRLRGPVKELRGVRPVIYREVRDIPDLLRPSGSGIKDPKVGQGFHGLPSDLPFFDEADAADEVAAEDEDVDGAEIDDIVDIAAAQSRADAAHSKVHVAVTPEQNEAARRLLRVLRRANRVRTAAASTAPLSVNFAKALDRTKAPPEMRKPYKLYFLGVVPVVLAALQQLHQKLFVFKKEAGKRMHTGNTDEMDEASKEVTWAQGLLKKVKRVQDALQPTSELHSCNNTSDLRLKIVEAKEITLMSDERMPVAGQTWEDITHAVKMMEPKRTQQVKPARPDLNMDDELEYL